MSNIPFKEVKRPLPVTPKTQLKSEKINANDGYVNDPHYGATVEDMKRLKDD